MWLSFLAFVVWGPILALTVSQPDAPTVFHYTSESGDDVGKGEERTLDRSEGYHFALLRSSANAVSFHITGDSSSGSGGVLQRGVCRA